MVGVKGGVEEAGVEGFELVLGGVVGFGHFFEVWS